MSIAVTYYRMSPNDFEVATRDQQAWDQFSNSLVTARLASLQATLQALTKPGTGNPESTIKSLQSLVGQKVDTRQFDLEKDWHTVYYLLTGESKIVEGHQQGNPLHNLIFGGLKTAVSTGYGAVRYFDHGLIGEIADALASVDSQELDERFDPGSMEDQDIYAAPDEGEQDGILRVIGDLTTFFRDAAAAKEFVIKSAT
jgi:hypothetical protein